MEVTCSSAVLVDFRWNKRYYIPKDRTLLSFSVLFFVKDPALEVHRQISFLALVA
jgi:hypothetical protein